MNIAGPDILRSIAGRLYVAMGILAIVLLASCLLTLSYTDAVSDSAKLLATTSINGVRTADRFDELLDQHRRTVVAAASGEGDATEAAAGLVALERDLDSLIAAPEQTGTGATGLRIGLRDRIAELEAFAREASAIPAGSEDHSALEHYLARVNDVEQDVAAWKDHMREAAAAELALLSDRSAFGHRIYLWLTIGGCLVVLVALLTGHSVLSGLSRLTGAMLALARGNLTVEVPFVGRRDEIGALSGALEIFRENAIRLAGNEANLSAALDNMVEGILMSSPNRVIVLHNQRFIDMLGMPRRDCRGMTAAEVFACLAEREDWSESMVRDLNERLVGIRRRMAAESFDLELKDGRFFSVTAAMLPNHHSLLSFEDTTERRASAARIFHLAHHDPLTELPNRAMFQEHLSAAVEDAIREHGIGVTLLLCDLDRFKDVNDTYGHPAGDELLRQVAVRMRETIRRTDILARLGGDEFAIIHLSGADRQDSAALGERILSALRPAFDIQGNAICAGMSIGIAQAPLDAATLVDLMKRADLALYAAKQGGRDRFAVYDPAMGERLEERCTIATEIRKALDAEGFEVHYQSMVDLRTRHILGFEALARWTHPELGVIAPAVFIPIAEESGHILRLGEWMLRRACFDATGWGAEVMLSVNVATQQFREEGFVETVRRALRDSGLPPKRLELEVTESAMLSDGARMLGVLHSLRAIGVHLALDDFGTGYSALSYLQKFPFDRIKIDQSFVRELDTNPDSNAIVRAVAGLGMNLGIATIAEGIETEDQAQLVLGAACDEGQGYLFSRPVPGSAVRGLLAEARSTERRPSDAAGHAIRGPELVG